MLSNFIKRNSYKKTDLETIHFLLLNDYKPLHLLPKVVCTFMGFLYGDIFPVGLLLVLRHNKIEATSKLVGKNSDCSQTVAGKVMAVCLFSAL